MRKTVADLSGSCDRHQPSFRYWVTVGSTAEEDDIFEKLERAGFISQPLKEKLKEMKGFRNILVHEYGEVDDQFVYEAIKTKLADFDAFKREILKALEKIGP